MMLEQFAGLARERIPTPAEFVEFVAGLGWRIDVRGDAAALRVPDRNDALALAMARMLSREPYRTGVLLEARRRWRAGQTAEPPAPPPPAREWLWRYGHTYTETSEDGWLWGHADRHPVGAWWWRVPGGPWVSIEGRGRGRQP
jgi:hypothetical protein